MSKKNAILLAGPALPGVDELHAELGRRADALAEAGLVLPPVSQAEMLRARAEIRRTHRSEGLRRKDVEGTWVRVVRAAEKTRSDVVIGQDGCAEASAEQIALLLDALAGFRVHVVLTSGDAALIDLWTPLVKKARVHASAAGDVDTLVAEVSALAVRERAEQVERRIDKLRKKRKRLRRQLAEIDAA